MSDDGVDNDGDDAESDGGGDGDDGDTDGGCGGCDSDGSVADSDSDDSDGNGVVMMMMIVIVVTVMGVVVMMVVVMVMKTAPTVAKCFLSLIKSDPCYDTSISQLRTPSLRDSGTSQSLTVGKSWEWPPQLDLALDPLFYTRLSSCNSVAHVSGYDTRLCKQAAWV